MTRPPHLLHTPRRARQGGAALLMAMVIVTLVSTLAASMVYQQYRAVRVEEAERVRSQGVWMLNGLLDFGRHWLLDDARRRPDWDDLTETWAQPMPETRLSSFLAADQNNNSADQSEDDTFGSGGVADAQGKFNLRNLVDADADVRVKQLKVFQALCQNLGLSAGIADLIQQRLILADSASRVASTPALLQQIGGASGLAAAPVMPASFDDLLWLGQGLTADLLERLRPYVTLLPEGGVAINLNTATREVIAAAIPKMDTGTAGRLVTARQRKPFRNLPADVEAVVGVGYDLSLVGIKSTYYEATGRLRFGEFTIMQRHLLQRDPQAVRVLDSVRVSGVTGQ